MNSEPNATIIGPGRFQWNAGSWFGSSLGSSAWMAVVTTFLAVNGQPLVAMVPGIGCAINVSVAIVLWNRRDRIYPFAALMKLLGVFAITFPCVWILVQLLSSQSSLTAMNWPVSPWPTVLVVLIVPALMIWFAMLERVEMDRRHEPGRQDNIA